MLVEGLGECSRRGLTEKTSGCLLAVTEPCSLQWDFRFPRVEPRNQQLLVIPSVIVSEM